MNAYSPRNALTLLCAALACGLPIAALAAPDATVRVVTAQPGSITRYVTLPGTVRAERQVTLYTKAPGFLKSIAVDTGDKVKAGQVLAQVESPELVADAARYRAEVEVARAAEKRVSDARKKSPDLIVPALVDEAVGRLRIAEASLERVETLLAYGRVTAPFDAVVTERFVDPGAYLATPSAGGSGKNAAVVTLMDASKVRFEVAVPENEAVRVRVGQNVRLRVESLGGRAFEGKVSRVAGALDESTRSMRIEADFPNGDGALLPGMFAKAELGVETRQSALLVPTAAIVREKTSAFVFVVENGVAKKTSVRLGFQDGAQTEVADGLKAGQSVAVSGGAPLADGQAVGGKS